MVKKLFLNAAYRITIGNDCPHTCFGTSPDKTYNIRSLFQIVCLKKNHKVRVANGRKQTAVQLSQRTFYVIRPFYNDLLNSFLQICQSFSGFHIILREIDHRHGNIGILLLPICIFTGPRFSLNFFPKRIRETSSLQIVSVLRNQCPDCILVNIRQIQIHLQIPVHQAFGPEIIPFINEMNIKPVIMSKYQILVKITVVFSDRRHTLF